MILGHCWSRNARRLLDALQL